MNLRVRLRTGGRFCSAAPWAGVHPADLNQSGNLHSHLSKSGQTLEKNGLLRSPGASRQNPPSEMSFTLPRKTAGFCRA